MVIIASALILLLSGPASAARPDILDVIQKSEAVLARIDSYTTIFHRREIVGERQMPEETILLKFKKPFMVYMKWLTKRGSASEALYVEGANNNRIRVRPRGIAKLLVLNLDPLGSLAMEGGRHPVTHSGLGHLMRIIGDNVRLGLKNREITLHDRGESVIFGRRVHTFEGVFPREDPAYYCHRAVVSMDTSRQIPVKVLIYDWKNRLVEDYGYEDTRLNAGLTDSDFNHRNKAYRLR